MVPVPLRNRSGEVVATALVDDDDAPRVLRYRWCLTAGGYAQRGVTRAGGKHTTYLLHREVLGLPPGDPRRADHINRNKLDCRKSNLRIATHAENMQNLGAGNRNTASRYRGVTVAKGGRKWQAQAGLNGRYHYLGLYDTEEEAAAVSRAFREANMPFTVEAA